MAVDAIGRVSQDQAALQNSGVGLTDFLDIFLTQLNFQDPLEPVDNREFITQLSSFSTLELTNRNVDINDGLSDTTAISQVIGLIGKEITVANNPNGATVGSVLIGENGNPQLSVVFAGTNEATIISPADITVVRDPQSTSR